MCIRVRVYGDSRVVSVMVMRQKVLAVVFGTSFFFSNAFRIFAVTDVTLLQNLVGDVLTSFSKPLQDLQYLLCFYA